MLIDFEWKPYKETDKNQGNKKFEDKLKKITLAYSQLKKTLGKK